MVYAEKNAQCDLNKRLIENKGANVVKKMFLILFLLSSVVLSACSRGQESVPAKRTEEIVIGANLEMSGKYEQSGDLAATAIRLALQEVNDAGGIGGRKISLVLADNKSSAAGSEQAFSYLAGDAKILLVIGPSRSATAIPAGNTTSAWKL